MVWTRITDPYFVVRREVCRKGLEKGEEIEGKRYGDYG